MYIVQIVDVLSFTELELTTSLRLTRLLTFNNTCIASDESGCTKRFLVFCVNLYKSTGNCQTESLTLACVATATESYLDVILVGNIQQVEWLLYNKLDKL